MSTESTASKLPIQVDEDEIFKSLNHKIRRDIVRVIGDKGKLSFTNIKNQIGDTDSPTLSYHLKSLNLLLISKENRYDLTKIGEAAYNLLTKTDQSYKVSKYRKRFIYAYIVTLTCWISVQTIIPLAIWYIIGDNFPTYYWVIVIILNVVSITNYIVIGNLARVK